jgi:heterodisulfide reductase subunit D
MMAKKIDLSVYTFRQLMELDACTRCGNCVTWCPTYAEKGDENITPRGKIDRLKRMARAQYGLLARIFGPREISKADMAIFSQGVFDCTLCGRCKVVCPVNIDTRPLWIAMRDQLVDEGQYPELFNMLKEQVTTHYNISGDPNENRLIWADNLPEVPEGVHKTQAEIVYFVGCVSSFYPLTYTIPQAFVSIMERSDVDFMTMGGEEWCCGFPLIIAGMGKHVEDLVRHNVEAVRKTGAKKLVATCPSCYHTFHHEYPHILGEPLGFEVVHATEALEEWIKEGRIQLGAFDRPVTYHDPCDLGRTSGIFDAPRNVINSIPGIEFVEMADNREYSLCCGGGGDVEMADAELSAGVARARLAQVEATGAQVLLSACQQCKRQLTAATRREKMRVRVMDVTELVESVMVKPD